jgi:membrane-associated protease RseP (regulator of RpoE activity)
MRTVLASLMSIRRFRRRAFRLALVVGVAGPSAGAQGDSTIRVLVRRGITPFEQQLERIAFDLITRRQIAAVLVEQLRSAQANTPSAAASTNTIRLIESRLASVNADHDRLQQELLALCPRDRQPEGWIGIAYSSSATFDMAAGRVVTRFSEYPDVESVERGSPAEKAGVQRGDRLLSIGGIDLRGGELAFRSLLKPGARLAVRVMRGVDTKALTVTVEPRPADYEVPCAWFDEQLEAALSEPSRVRRGGRLPGAVTIGDEPPIGRRVQVFPGQGSISGQAAVTIMSGEGELFTFRLGGGTTWAAGAQLSPLNEDLGRALGAERGVLVLDVSRRSAAARSGLRGGDVIVSADGRAVQRPSDLLEHMNAAASGELKLQVVRLKKTESLTLQWRADSRN